MKKFASLILAVVLLSCMVLPGSATAPTQSVYNIGNKTIVFEENSVFTEAQKEYIANLLVDPEYGVAPANLICTLFGHNNDSESVVAITHCDQPDDPRCLEEAFIMTVCARCGASSVEKSGYRHISCCPEE